MRLPTFVIAGLLLLYGGIAWGQEMSFDARLSTSSTPARETILMQLQCRNFEPDEVPATPEVDGLSIEYRGSSQNTNSSFTYTNGRMVQQSEDIRILSYALTPERPGTFTIPAIRVRAGGRPLSSQPLRLVVTPARDYSRYAFSRIRTADDRKEYYVGEVFEVFAELFHEANVQVDQMENPVFDGFLLNRTGSGNPHRVRVGERTLNRIVFRFATRAIKSGELVLGPVRWNTVFLFRSGGRRNSLFPLLDDRIRKEVPTESPPLPVRILPLPREGRPQSFGGGVGRFTMEVEASPLEVTVGDPVTIRVRITGRGALDGISLPSPDHWTEFREYPETSRVELAPDQLSGTCTFEKVVIPVNAEVKAIPALEWSYFDPEAGEYRTLQSESLPLDVRPGSGRAAPLPLPEQTDDPEPAPTGLTHIKPRLGNTAASPVPLLGRPWFLWLQCLPLLAWIAGYLHMARRNLLERNPGTLRERRVRQLVRRGLAELKGLAAENRSREFHATLVHLLQEQIGSRLDLPSAAITEEVLRTREIRDHLDPHILERLNDLFMACNQSRYAPGDSESELSHMAETAAEVLSHLQSLPHRDMR